MSATIISDPMIIPAAAPETPQSAAPTKIIGQLEVEFAKCECCGLTEECTPAYIVRVRERYSGKWICGLCAEAVKDETDQRLITTEEAVAKHTSFCEKFFSSRPPPDPTVHLIAAMRQILRKSLDSPIGLRSTPSSPKKDAEISTASLARSESCISSLSG